MNVTSYNVTDVSYHYIGLRVLANLPVGASRAEQTKTISRGIRKYVYDKSLRLMLPEPRGTFETSGEKVCQELVHLGFAASDRSSFLITEQGREVVSLLDSKKYTPLRRVMTQAHLRVYDNVRALVEYHLSSDGLMRPVLDTDKVRTLRYVACLLEPTFRERANEEAKQILPTINPLSTKKFENALQERVLKAVFPDTRISVPIFRSLSDRLASLRLLNMTKWTRGSCDFVKTYTPCVVGCPPHSWYTPLNVEIALGKVLRLFLCEPDMTDSATQHKFLGAIFTAFEVLPERAGYFSLPEVRDRVCESFRIPEASFDEGVNKLLDQNPTPLSVGLQYEGISTRSRPLVRDRGTPQIYNLIRSA